MDEKMAALVGAAAALTFAGRGLRPITKLAMKGVVVAGDLTTDARRGIVDLYAEAKSERRSDPPPLPSDPDRAG
ncbi:MAG: hypothetical protein M3P50_03045 [Actinomycetota bacterium]|nr:hypothetical protein [Actinomycetota bacterium]